LISLNGLLVNYADLPIGIGTAALEVPFVKLRATASVYYRNFD
jgi:hypothetical protein